MAWELLPVDYTDAVWDGLKRYNEITNDDGTVSFQDVTQYSNREKSFFGAKEANRMDEALNTLMNMVENGTDLYEAFQNYFAEQKTDFEKAADAKQSEYEDYLRWWLRDVQSASTFAYVSLSGAATNIGASDWGGVRPAFLIG